MVQAIVYKEWLKIRWTLLILFLLSAGILINIWINLAHGFRFNEPSGMWAYIIFRKYVFFDLMQYFPLLAGLALAIAQFLPEIHRTRLRLPLRLPLPENRIIFQMSLVALLGLIGLLVIDQILLISVSAIYLPREIVGFVFKVSLPWNLAGIAAYFAVITILIEPVWTRRLILGLIMYAFLQSFYQPAGMYSYGRIMIPFAVLAFLPGLMVYYAIHRYQKGVA